MKKSTTKKKLCRLDATIEFDQSDFDLMDLALNYDQELRLCAGIVREARRKKLSFPLKSVKSLLSLLPSKSVFVEGHHLNEIFVERYMPKEYFPVSNEMELLSRCYLALVRCRSDVQWASRAPKYAQSLLKEYSKISKVGGKL